MSAPFGQQIVPRSPSSVTSARSRGSASGAQTPEKGTSAATSTSPSAPSSIRPWSRRPPGAVTSATSRTIVPPVPQDDDAEEPSHLGDVSPLSDTRPTARCSIACVPPEGCSHHPRPSRSHGNHQDVLRGAGRHSEQTYAAVRRSDETGNPREGRRPRRPGLRPRGRGRPRSRPCRFPWKGGPGTSEVEGGDAVRRGRGPGHHQPHVDLGAVTGRVRRPRPPRAQRRPKSRVQAEWRRQGSDAGAGTAVRVVPMSGDRRLPAVSGWHGIEALTSRCFVERYAQAPWLAEFTASKDLPAGRPRGAASS
jgi:hypothetical protein